ncbi:MAG: NTP transferase domain-containing protein [Verrucomicrobia bacterium]|jgi:UTP-glucose-1-phosphate uridylyltransferase|nr:MAG: NTP transferase domain-containing protein [Verrucomicrobiota bacterium]MDH4470662.1 NTP transferase domain-containing protein [Verrucomicrobiae bacterium]
MQHPSSFPAYEGDRDEISGLTLVILAAGMGSRYGKLKQLDPVGPDGEALLDYSIHDAVQAGFGEIVFVIRKEIAHLFEDHIASRYAKQYPGITIRFAFQELKDLPKPFSLSRMRSKPWGTGHALLAVRHLVTSAFVVINADDYYGPSGYLLLKDFLLQLSLSISNGEQDQNRYAMVAYLLKNTLSEHGKVSRGVCRATQDYFMIDITEQTSIHKTAEGIVSDNKEGSSIMLTGEEWVSLNFWGFTPAIFSFLEKEFTDFLTFHLDDPKAEFYLPSVVNKMIHEKSASVKLLPSQDPWFGLTHPSDLVHVKNALLSLRN